MHMDNYHNILAVAERAKVVLWNMREGSILHQINENEINGHPDKEWDLNFIQMTGEANRGALSVLSMYQVEDADEEDQIHTEYRLSSLTWTLDDSTNKFALQKGPIDHMQVAETCDDRFQADQSAIFLPAFPNPEIRIYDFVAPLFTTNL